MSSRGKRRRRHNRRVRRRTQMRPRHSPDASAPLKTKTKCTAARVPPLEKRAKTSPAAAAFSVHSPFPPPKVGSPYAHVFCCRQSHNNSSTTRNSCSERRGLQPLHEEPTAGSATIVHVTLARCGFHGGRLCMSSTLSSKFTNAPSKHLAQLPETHQTLFHTSGLLKCLTASGNTQAQVPSRPINPLLLFTSTINT